MLQTLVAQCVMVVQVRAVGKVARVGAGGRDETVPVAVVVGIQFRAASHHRHNMLAKTSPNRRSTRHVDSTRSSTRRIGRSDQRARAGGVVPSTTHFSTPRRIRTESRPPLTHSLTYPSTHPRTHSLTHLPTQLPTHLPTQSPLATHTHHPLCLGPRPSPYPHRPSTEFSGQSEHDLEQCALGPACD